MAGPALAHVKGVRLSLGAAALFDGVEFVLHKGERACLVGANGAGKSTLMRMLAGVTEPDDGEIAFSSGVHVAFVPQDPDLASFATLREYAMSPSVRRGGVGAPAHAAEAELETLGLDPERAPARLSGGETRRAALARAFAADPDILLLDEPTNHLDIAAIEALEARIAAFRGAALIISHDRRFLQNTSTATLWLRQRRVLKLDRGFAAFEDWAEQVETDEARALARLETHLKAEEHWLQRGVTARRSRNEGRRRKLMAMRQEKRERTSAIASPQAALQGERGAESARLVIEAKRISKSFGERAILKDFSLRVLRGDRVGIVGPNGAGKTTLLELLLKRAEPDAGEVRLGLNLEIAYVDQTRAALDPEATLRETLTPLGGDQVMVRGKPRHVAAYAKDFLFGPDQLRQPLGALSGGERNRVALAVALAKPANLLVLDEPTNDLDMDTLDALEDMLAAYDGTILIVSHDRAFLDGVATQIIGPLGGGRWVETPGGWSDFEREYPTAITPAQVKAKPERDAAPAPTPRRTTKLSYKDERRAAEIDALLPKLSAEIQALEAQFAEANAFGGDQAALQSAAAKLEQLRRTKDEAESEWLEIEERREALSANKP
ncbi:MAG: ABC-F family ATP-binding cassette domain-containing protein [Hyphomonadaceae bacterium]|nr:ABC-F family ATP-binding cassette domain-containing protein [Hyphomonadaceae bacterium]